MDHWAQRVKPAASRRTHLLLAAMMWTVVGALLLYFGVRWVLRTDTSYAYVQLAAAVCVGVAKARFVLAGAAGRIVERIETRGDGHCLGGFVSLKTWALVALMVGMGRLLRGSPLSEHVVGLVYTAVGTALLLGSRYLWQALCRRRIGD